MFPFYVFAVVSMLIFGVTNSVMMRMDLNTPSRDRVMAETVEIAHNTAVLNSDQAFSTIHPVSGGVARIDTRYWDNSPFRSYAVLTPGVENAKYVLTYMPREAHEEPANMRIEGYLSNIMIEDGQDAGFYDSAIGRVGGVTHNFSVPFATGMANNDIYIFTDIIAYQRGS